MGRGGKWGRIGRFRGSYWRFWRAVGRVWGSEVRGVWKWALGRLSRAPVGGRIWALRKYGTDGVGVGARGKCRRGGGCLNYGFLGDLGDHGGRWYVFCHKRPAIYRKLGVLAQTFLSVPRELGRRLPPGTVAILKLTGVGRRCWYPAALDRGVIKRTFCLDDTKLKPR